MGLGGRTAGEVVHGEQNAKRAAGDYVVALGGNPNVGKSTVFNSLTGLRQHTGNWPGKTVANARGKCRHDKKDFLLVDLPGTYSLMANSVEEEIARDYICFGGPDAIVIVADATCLERNLNLVLQTLELTSRAVVCVNLIDEARRKKITIDIKKLSAILGVPVIGTNARSNQGLGALMDAVQGVCAGSFMHTALRVSYEEPIEKAVALLEPPLRNRLGDRLSSRWTALRLLDADDALLKAVEEHLGFRLLEDEAVVRAMHEARAILGQAGLDKTRFRDALVSRIVKTAEEISEKTVTFGDQKYNETDRRIDRALTSRAFGIPIMVLLLGLVLWITITGANYPSELLANGLFRIEDHLSGLFVRLGAPDWLHGMLVTGVYRTVAWVVSVMLPPMAIFFPLFTLLEDLGYLPRIAFNLDKFFQKACAHGKQALTMCMGFGCNAAGVIGCRIIDSPRERLIAIITNNFVPCNGRFPTLIAIIAMFFTAYAAGAAQSAVSTLMLTGVIVLGVAATLLVSRFLSRTILRGLPSSFALELPSYRKPQVCRVVVRSLFDRTLFVLGRAVMVAAPAGLIIWAMANIHVAGSSLLRIAAGSLDPFARMIGLDGYILMAFILGFPANEIVVPIIIMSYTAAGSMLELGSLNALRSLLVENGWTWLTAVCAILFSLMHWPCGTTCWTIGKETRSAKWTIISFLVPTLVGIAVCFAVASAARLLGLV
ncbi:MAG: ferrous iron transport protein B [Clostridiales bacterium]|nr:ferrous iron transport protein B [Clostridiales bacterium]